MLGRRIWRFFKHHLVSEVPDEMAGCVECNVARCSNGEYETCPYRLARIPTLKVKQGSEPELGARS